jgi:hypothetical protein
MEDPGRLPYRQLLNESHRVEAESEARAELHAQARAERKARRAEGGRIRQALRRATSAVRRER